MTSRIALSLIAFAMLPCACLADVVPPRAVHVATTWLRLVDRGDRRAAAKALDASSDERDAIVRRAAAGTTLRTANGCSTTIASWAGHGDGDTSRMAPGGYFSLVFETTCRSGAAGVDEVRLVPRGDGDWRVVDYVRR